MRTTELLRLVWLNINQNKFKSIMTSIGIVVGTATIMLVMAIGRGGQMDIADQFAELNAGEINVTYEYEEEEAVSSGGGFFGSIGNFFGSMMGGFGFGGGMPSGGASIGGSTASGGASASGGAPSGGDMPSGAGGPSGEGMPSGNPFAGNPFGENSFDGNPFEQGQDEAETEQSDQMQSDEAETDKSLVEDRLNQYKVTLTEGDVEDIQMAVPGITGAAITYTTQTGVEGGNLLSEKQYTIAGVKEAFEDVSRLELETGAFITEEQDSGKERVCVLGSTAAREIFGSAEAAFGQKIYLDGRTYTVTGILRSSGTIAGSITMDSTIFVPYETGIKYITGSEYEPTITVVAEDVDTLQSVISGVKTVLQRNYTDVTFTFTDAGSKMKAAESSNRILTMLLSAMAAIVFVVGGIGIMNVLFVSVKERTNEIGILKAIGTAQGSILMEFLLESAAISFMGGVLGLMGGFLVSPIVSRFSVRVEITLAACLISIGFAVLTGTIFGFYPAWKASRLEPVDALNAE